MSEVILTHEQAFEEIEFINEYNARIATNLRRAQDLIEFAENSCPLLLVSAHPGEQRC
jgi:hypothetical protein